MAALTLPTLESTKVSVYDAMTEVCPTCGAIVGEVCHYLADKPIGSTLDYRRSYNHAGPLAYAYRAGDPLKTVVHGERRALVRDKRFRARRLAWLAENRPSVVPMPAWARAAGRAMREYDVREAMALREWWGEHGHIIANANRTRQDGTVRGEPYGWGPG